MYYTSLSKQKQGSRADLEDSMGTASKFILNPMQAYSLYKSWTLFHNLKILCGLVHLIVLLHQLQAVIITIQEDVMSAPLKVVPLAFMISDSMYVVCWMYTFWRKPSHPQAFMMEISNAQSSTTMRPWLLKSKSFLFTLVPFIFFTFTVFYHGLSDAPVNSLVFINYCITTSTTKASINQQGFGWAWLVIGHFPKLSIPPK